MIEQLKTIRDGLENFTEPYLQKALTALAKIEAMVGEQEPQRCDDCGDTVPKRKCYCRAGCVHEAAPVAQQYEAGDIASAAAQGFRDGVASVAQQPQAEKPLAALEPASSYVQPVPDHCDRIVWRNRYYHLPLKQPQAEAVPQGWKLALDEDMRQRADKLASALRGSRVNYAVEQAAADLILEMRDALVAAPQQAEAVPPDVVRDAERYRWLRNESWAGYNTGKGTPSVYTVDGAGNRRMMLAEEAMDDAIDAAIAQQKGVSHE